MLLHRTFLALSIVLSFASCKNQNTNQSQEPQASRVVLPSSTGHLSELVVVVSKDLWRSEVGAIVKGVFQEGVKAIPQDEALFDLYNIESKDFSSIFQTHKNILWLRVGDKASLDKKEQKWAKNQLFVSVSHTSEALLAQSLQKHAHEIRAWFMEKDQRRRLASVRKTAEKDLEKELKSTYDVGLTLPKGYQIAVAEENFVWLRRDNPSVNIISNLWIHVDDYRSPEQLSKARLIQLRDSLGMVHVEGSRAQSFMATEMIYDPDYDLASESPYTIETKGLWTMVNDFLGGSYVAQAMIDEKNQRLVYIEGFLYCPNERKRSHILELEAVLSSVQL